MDVPDESALNTFLRHNKLPVAIFVISLFIFGCGLIVILWPRFSHSSDVTFSLQDEKPLSSVKTADAKTTTGKTIMVDVAGGVNNPGVYTLTAESRMQDAIVKAGGLSKYADNAEISRTLNLATKLRDGMKIYIPLFGEETPANSEVQGSASSSLINVNTASSTELDSLPGIGEVTAEKVITNRPYQSLEELVSKKVLSAKVFEQVKEKISLD